MTTFAELLGLSNAFGMDQQVNTGEVKDQAISEKRASLPPPPAAGTVTFTPAQLAMLASMGSTPYADKQRAPGGVAPRPPQVPGMTQLTLPNVQPVQQAGLGSLLYGGGR